MTKYRRRCAHALRLRATRKRTRRRHGAHRQANFRYEDPRLSFKQGRAVAGLGFVAWDEQLTQLLLDRGLR